MARSPHPIWGIVKDQGRSYVWLARKTGYSVSHVRGLASQVRGWQPGPRFRQRAAELLEMPEEELFLPPAPKEVA